MNLQNCKQNIESNVCVWFISKIKFIEHFPFIWYASYCIKTLLVSFHCSGILILQKILFLQSFSSFRVLAPNNLSSNAYRLFSETPCQWSILNLLLIAFDSDKYGLQKAFDNGCVIHLRKFNFASIYGNCVNYRV